MKGNKYMDLKNYLKQARTKLGYTQQKAADKIGVSIDTIQNWENGKVKYPSKELFGIIIQTYQLDKETFLQYYMNELRKEISNVEVQPDTLIILADENLDMPDTTHFKNVVMVNPYKKDNSYYINPFCGEECNVIDVWNQILVSQNLSTNDCVITLQNAITLLKRLLGDNATLFDLKTLLNNIGDEGRKNYVMPFRKMSKMSDGSAIPMDKKNENDEIVDWFLNTYYAGIGGASMASKTYANTGCLHTKLNTLLNDPYFRAIFTPSSFLHELNLYHLSPNSLIIFQCLSKNEPFYQFMNAQLDAFEKTLKIKRMNGELDEIIEVQK